MKIRLNKLLKIYKNKNKHKNSNTIKDLNPIILKKITCQINPPIGNCIALRLFTFGSKEYEKLKSDKNFIYV